MNPVQPRTILQIIADLLQIAVDTQWSAERNRFQGDYGSCCPECDVLAYEDDDHKRPNEHKPDCKRMALIEEVRAYLRVENKLAEERGEDTVDIP